MADFSEQKPLRVAYFATHPIQYQAPLLRYLARDRQIDLHAFFYSDYSLRKHVDPGYGVGFKWDVPLTDGYKHSFLRRAFPGDRLNRKSWNPAIGVTSVLRQGKFDLVWIHGWSHICSLQGLWAARKLRIPALFRGDSVPDRMCIAGRRKAWAPVCQSAILRRAHGFLAIGSANRQFYSERNVRADRVFLMPHAVDNGFFGSQARTASERRTELRAKLGLDPNRPVTLFVGRLARVKGAELLIDALETLWKSNRGKGTRSPTTSPSPIPHVLFVGDGPARSELEARARNLGPGAAQFAGFRNQTELPAFYDLCDLLVLPSRFEPWGLVVNEVMNAGRPVIVSDRVGAGMDLVQHRVNGWVYPHGDAQALAKCLEEAFTRPGGSQEMGRRSFERISRWDFEADRIGLWSAANAVCE